MKTIYEISDCTDQGYIRVSQQPNKPGSISLTMGINDKDWLNIELSLAEFHELCNIRYKLIHDQSTGSLMPFLAQVQEVEHA